VILFKRVARRHISIRYSALLGELLEDFGGPLLGAYGRFLQEMKGFFSNWEQFIRAYTRRIDEAATDTNDNPTNQRGFPQQ
jgi:hypothetical protein